MKRVINFAELALPRLFQSELLSAKRDVPGQLHCQRAGPSAGEVALQDITDKRDENSGYVQSDMAEEVAVFGGDDGIAQHFRNVVVLENHAALGRVLADQLASRA